MKHIYSKYFGTSEKLLAVLIDPEKHSSSSILSLINKVNQSKIDLIFVGSSLSSHSYNDFILELKTLTKKPILLFPGNSLQLSSNVDALLNLSLISGRNPDLLIGEHVKSAMQIKKSKVEVIATAYILIDGGRKTSVEYMSNTQAIPRDKVDIAVATALAGEFLGMKCIYLEAGSGAIKSVPNTLISEVRKQSQLPIICGGGIKSKKEVVEKWTSGANIVVIGTAFEKNIDILKEF